MALRSLSRAGVEMGARVAGTGSKCCRVPHPTRHVGGAERKMSSFVGQGPGHQAPSFRQGSLGAGTQLFKLVETDLMSKELTRYGPADAEHLGLHSIQDVLSDIAAATLTPHKLAAPAVTAVDPSAEVASVPTSEEPAAAPAVREEEVLAAWGLGPVVTDGSEVEGIQAPPVGEVGEEGGEVSNEKMAIKRTYQPSTLKRKRKHGFLYRAKTRLGKKILRRRQDKGRWRLGI
ncbi:unnamed protein product [Ectocarpus sp. 4 AP-2014]